MNKKGERVITEKLRLEYIKRKGRIPWNKGKKTIMTAKIMAAHKKSRGISKSKPFNFPETMRKVNPPHGRKICAGYVLIYLPEYVNSRKSPPNYGYIYEHRYIMEQYLGRSLICGRGRGKCKETIHHLNGDKSDNRIENLILCTTVSEHMGIHNKMEQFVCNMIKTGEVYYDKEKKVFVRRNS